MIVVTGTAPRCGTSAMMRELLKEYKPHSYSEKFPAYSAKEKNPEGFWDIKKEALFTDELIPTEEDSVIKLWHPQFHRVNTSEVQSIRSCAIAEGQLEPSPKQISQLFRNQQQGISSIFNENTQLRVRMETLRKNPESVLSYVKEIL
jgi:hypothetical protein